MIIIWTRDILWVIKVSNITIDMFDKLSDFFPSYESWFFNENVMNSCSWKQYRKNYVVLTNDTTKKYCAFLWIWKLYLNRIKIKVLLTNSTIEFDSSGRLMRMNAEYKCLIKRIELFSSSMWSTMGIQWYY